VVLLEGWVLLSSLVELTEEGTSRLEAIDVQRGVSDADFEAEPNA
jgi:hypothetical protein